MPPAEGEIKRRFPGEEGLWGLIGGELFAFSAFFLVFAWYRGLAPEIFQQGHLQLNHGIGLINTLILLTSSLFAAMGAARVSEGRGGAAF